jgi:putative MFS transporter
MALTADSVLTRAGIGPFQKKLLGVFGLVWAADAMQVLAVGFTAAAIARTFGLTVPQALQTGTGFFLGMLIGASLFGRLADRFGRRRVLLFTVALDAVFGLLSALAPSFWVLVIFRFMTGLAVGGTLPVDYAMMAEFLPPERRGRWLVILEGFWAVGTVAVALAAWWAASRGIADPWRYIFAFTAIPAIIGLGLRFWVPESPLYLLKTGRSAEAAAVMNRVLTGNGKAPLAPGESLTLPAAPQGGSIFAGPLARRTFVMLALWFLVSLSYYGVFTWMPGKLAAGDFGFVKGYGFLVVVALAQIPGYALAAFGVEAWGRKPTLTAFLMLSALGCLLFTVADSAIMVGGALLLMSFALLGCWGALYAYTPELYPTHLRATGMGTAGSMARLGGLLAPSALAGIAAQSFGTAVALFAALLALAGLLSLFIDTETRHTALD